MPSVLFWPGVGGGTEHYRCRTPGAALARAGWEVRYVEDDDTDFAVDVVVLQRVNHPAVPDLIRGLQTHGVKVVYDIDDWYDDVPDYNPFSRQAPSHLPTIHACLTLADLVTVSTDELADGYARFGPVDVLPNYLDPDLWPNPPRRELRRHVHVGWLGQHTWRAGDLDLLRPWLADFLHRHPEVRFAVAGSPPDIFDNLAVPGVICNPSDGHYTRRYEDLPRMLAGFDIGLVPLTFNRFNQAKSWCKGMEYGAAGVPVVASPSREYRKFVEPGVNGQLARDWPKAIDRILGDLPGYQQRARQIADAYVIDRHVDRWADAYLSLIRREVSA